MDGENNGNPLLKMDGLGVPPFKETSIYMDVSEKLVFSWDGSRWLLERG